MEIDNKYQSFTNSIRNRDWVNALFDKDKEQEDDKESVWEDIGYKKEGGHERARAIR
jgi:competence transcription factor ComK